MARILFITPPVRLNTQEYEYLIHWPRHALVMAAELDPSYEFELLDITAEFLAGDPESGLSGPTQDLARMLDHLVQDGIREKRPDVIAVHAHAAPHLPVVKRTLEAIERARSQQPVVIGGMAASHLSRELGSIVPESARPATWIVRGEATGRTQDIFDLVLGSRRPDVSCERVEMQPTGIREVLVSQNPAQMPYARPRFDLLNKAVYQRLFESGQFVPHLEMTSGCTFGCTFCGVHYPGANRRFRRRPLSAVIDELRHVRDAFGFSEFYFCDETFSLDMRLAAAFCRSVINELPGIRWRCVTRVDRIDDELAELMANAGCYEIGFGIESANDRILSDVDKRATVGRNRAAIDLVQRHGIAANALTIIGLPHEDHADIRRTFEFLASDAKPKRAQIFVFHPVPGTEFYTHPEKHGLHIDVRSVEDWYLFDHIGPPVCDTPNLSREDIVRYFLLFNRALSTILDPDRDETLIKRVVENRFPVRRKGVAWLNSPGHTLLYRGTDPAADILENTLEVDPNAAGQHSSLVDHAPVLEFVLTRCTGTATETEIANEVARLWELDPNKGAELTQQALNVLREGGFVSDF